MKKLREAIDPLTVALVAVAILLVALLLYTRGLMEQRLARQSEPDPTVIAFLDDYIAATGVASRERAAEVYFDGSQLGVINHDGQSELLIKLDAVFLPDDAEKRSYRVCSSQQNYIEIMLLSESGDDLPCRIGMFYRVSGTGKISSFSITRLQPIDRTDSEWRREWL